MKITTARMGYGEALLRITAHANILSRDNMLISADYFGVTRRLLEEQYGRHVFHPLPLPHKQLFSRS